MSHSFWLSTSFIDIQLVWFPELEPESVLQPKLDLSGNVAAKRPRDLWETEESQLSWQDDRADEKEISQLHGWQGTDNIPHRSKSYYIIYHIIINVTLLSIFVSQVFRIFLFLCLCLCPFKETLFFQRISNVELTEIILKCLFSSGRSLVQCLWGRYCYCEYLFWRINSVR